MSRSVLIDHLTDLALQAHADYSRHCKFSSSADERSAEMTTASDRHEAALLGLAQIEAVTVEQVYQKARALQTCIWERKDIPDLVQDDCGLAASLIRDLLRSALAA